MPLEGVYSSSIVYDGGAAVQQEPVALFCAEDSNSCHLEVYPRAGVNTGQDEDDMHAVMDHMARLNMFASFNLIDYIVPLIAGPGSGPEDWDPKALAALATAVDRYKHHPSVLGW